MRSIRAAAGVLMLGLELGSLPATAQPAKSVRAEELGATVQVIGRLQQPLGTVVQIEATIVDGESLRQKQYQGAYLLRIESVAGKRLPTAEIMPFAADSGVLPANSFELYESKHGKKAASIDSNEIRALNKGYVGQRVTLLCYETGSFSGIPKNLPNELIWQDTAFQFTPRLVIVKRVTPAAQR